MNKRKRQIELVSRFLFILYVLVLVYFCFFAEQYGRTAGDIRYNLQPFREIRRFWTYREKVGMFGMFTNIFGNIICFIPFGFFLPAMNRVFRKHGFLVLLMGFGTSLTVELVQLYYRVGCFDVDDLLLNSCGVLMGWLLSLPGRWIGRKLS